MRRGAEGRGRFAPFLAITMILLTSAAPVARAADVAPEASVKAEFIERISRFVDWPEDSFAGDDAPFAICLVGDDPFGDYLNKMARERRIQGRHITLTHISDLGRLGACNLVFIAHSEDKRLDKILTLTAGRPILTVGDTEGFADRGVLVNFYRVGDNVRFEINVVTVDKSGLHVSSKIMRLARRVGKRP